MQCIFNHACKIFNRLLRSPTLPLPVFVSVCSSLDGGDADFLKTVLGLGCEVHGFNPSTSSASDDRIGNSLAGNRGNRGGVSQHKLWLEWRAPRRHKHKTRGNLGSVSQTLADIMAALGHHTVRDAHAHTPTHTCRETERNTSKQTYLRVFSPQQTQKAHFLGRHHSNRALGHLWLPWQQFR